MNKKLKMYFENLGFTVEKNNAYGKISGYEVSANVAMFDQIAPVKLHVNLYVSYAEKMQIINEIKALKFKYFVIDEDMFGIKLGFNDPLTVGKLLNRMPEMIDKIFEVFKKYEAKGIGYCPVCGEELPLESKQYKIEWVKVKMDESCLKEINADIEEDNKEFNEAPNNYLKGVLGALIGALAGFVAFIAIFYLGYITSLTSFIAILLGTFLYKKFGGKQNRIMIIIVSTISILAMILGLFTVYVLYAKDIANDLNLSYSGSEAFKEFMSVSEFKKEFISNLSMTIVFTALGVVYEIIILSKSVKRQGKIK